MVIVSLMGGLGNQLFQYAFGLRLASDWNTDLQLNQFLLSSRWLAKFRNYTPRSFELDVFGIEQPSVSPTPLIKAVLRADSMLLRESPDSALSPIPITQPANQVFCMGYWQSERYFKDVDKVVRERMQFKKAPSKETYKLVDKIQQTTQSVFLHVRRGDYITNTDASQHHGFCGDEYYNRAILHIRKQVAEAQFFIFSDDLPWVKRELGDKLKSAVYVEGNVGADSWQDMYLMTHCHHAIIANSSFSWWGAWLNPEQERVVIAPKQWLISQKPDLTMTQPSAWQLL
ncbi:MAG: alpha-1,2-fucosyltransferase [Cytophagales bacterium]|nr:MAG: alpha-1,2-fucosyltransferase [Cytophagales bacterium]